MNKTKVSGRIGIITLVVLMLIGVIPIGYTAYPYPYSDATEDFGYSQWETDEWSDWLLCNWTIEGGGGDWELDTYPGFVVVNETLVTITNRLAKGDTCRLYRNLESQLYDPLDLYKYRGTTWTRIDTYGGDGNILYCLFLHGSGANYMPSTHYTWNTFYPRDFNYYRIDIRYLGTSTSKYQFYHVVGNTDGSSGEFLDLGGVGYTETIYYNFEIERLNSTAYRFTTFNSTGYELESSTISWYDPDGSMYGSIHTVQQLLTCYGSGSSGQIDAGLQNVYVARKDAWKVSDDEWDYEDITDIQWEKYSSDNNKIWLSYGGANGSRYVIWDERDERYGFRKIISDINEHIGHGEADGALYSANVAYNDPTGTTSLVNRGNLLKFVNSTSYSTETELVANSIYAVGLQWERWKNDEWDYHLFMNYHDAGALTRVELAYNSINGAIQYGETIHVKMEYNSTHVKIYCYNDTALTSVVAYLDWYEIWEDNIYMGQVCSISPDKDTTSYWGGFYIDDLILFGSVEKEIEEPPDGEWIGVWTPTINFTTLQWISPSGISMNMTDDWIFMGEVYKLILTGNNTDYANVTFTDGYHNITFEYYNASNRFTILTEDELVVGLINGEATETDIDNQTIYCEIAWTFILEKNIVDYDDCIFQFTAQNRTMTNRTVATVYSNISTHYNIYNLGGKIYYEFGGDGARITGGDAFELEATNGTIYSNATAYVVFRKLQHMHMMFSVSLDNEMSGDNLVVEHGGYIKGGFDYRIGGEWVTGWNYVINIDDAEVGTNFGGTNYDASWIRLQVKWFNQNDLIKTDYIYTYHEGYDKDSMPVDRNDFRLWVDLWFNRMNASTVIGGRVNAYYFGMKELGTWWFGYGDFRPVKGNVTSSMFFDELKDDSSNVINCKVVGLVRAWVQVRKIPNADTDDDTWSIREYNILNFKLASDRMEGVDTPIFVETKEITMPQTGFLQPLYKAISNIGNAVTQSIFNVAKLMIGAVDTFLVYMGLPSGTFSTMMNLVMIQFTTIIGYLEIITTQITNMLLVMGYMITAVGSFMGMIIDSITWLALNCLGTPLHMIKFFIAILNGTDFTYMGNTWNLTGDYVGILDAGKSLLPYVLSFAFIFWLFTGNPYGAGKDSPEQIPKRVIMAFSWLKEAYTSIFWIYTRLKNEIISMYNFIRSHIPSMGGSGGESPE